MAFGRQSMEAGLAIPVSAGLKWRTNSAAVRRIFPGFPENAMELRHEFPHSAIRCALLPSLQPDPTMHFCRPLLIAVLLAAMPLSAAGASERDEPDIDMYAHISGKCTTLKVAGRDFGCKAVAYFHSQQGRAHFTIVLDDPKDASHIVSFSGETGRREQDNIYELQVDRMLLNSKDRPKVDGLPVPLIESSTGLCRQTGIISTRQISSISCAATARDGRKYELQFESDGEPVALRRIRQSSLEEERARVRKAEQLECRRKASVAKILPRDRTAYVIRCLADDEQKPAQ